MYQKDFEKMSKVCVNGLIAFPDSSMDHVGIALIPCPCLPKRIVNTAPSLLSSNDFSIPRVFIKHRKAGSSKSTVM